MRRGLGTRSSDGVTLLELLVAVAILATVFALLYGTFSRTFLTRTRVEARARQFAAGRIAIDWLERDIAGCGAVAAFPEGDALFVSSGVGDRQTEELDTPLLHITTASALGTGVLEVETTDATPMNPGRGDQARVLYRLEIEDDQDMNDLDKEHLVLARYEWRPPRSGDREEASRSVIARGVRSLRLRFSADGEDWKDAWDSRTGTGIRIPTVAEITLVLHGVDGADLGLVSATAIVLGGSRG